MMVENRRKAKDIVELPRKVHRTGRGLLQALLTVVVIALGIGGAIVLIKLKKPPQRQEQQVQPPLVKVEQLRVKDIPMVVQGYGTVNPKVGVDIVPEVAGKVVHVHPELKVGGLIRANEEIM
jgi:multidrug efflux system membrane fusion protein